MQPKEYLVTYKYIETLEFFDMFYITANDIDEARKIAEDLTHEYDDVMYFELLASVELA